MRRLGGSFWRAITLTTVVMLLIGLATQAGTAAVAAGRSARAATAHMTLAQRRAQVLKQTSATAERARAMHLLSHGLHPRLSRAQLAALIAKQRAAAAKRGYPSAGRRPGTSTWNAFSINVPILTPSGETSFGTYVVPGESLTASAAVLNDSNTSQ